MVSSVADGPSQVRLAGVVLASSSSGRFAALAFDGDAVLRQLEGIPDQPETGQRLVELADGVPVITDTPRRALEVLSRAGARSPVVWDVLELAALLAPGCPSGGLDRATAYFGISVDGSGLVSQAQRALMLFELVATLLDRIETPTLLHVARLGVGLDWPLRLLFSETLRRRAVSPLESGTLAAGTPIGAWVAQGAPGRRRRHTSNPVPGAAQLDAADVSRRLALDADIAHALPGYEARDEQVRMAQLVTQTLNEGGQLLLEAGTGTGKGLAYLLPAALHALKNARRVVVSTATTTLQDQLFDHDLPLVQAGLGSRDGQTTEPLRATVLKGRANYLCLRRWQTLLHAGDLSTSDRTLLIKTLFWLPHTLTGDRAELHLSPAEEDAWQRLSAISEACTPLRCAYHRIGVCFLARARRAAEDSHIVIANHALLLSDLASRSRVLPDYDVLIVDEAHHLEDEATHQLGWRLGERELLNRLERLWSPGPGDSGAVPEAVGLIAASSGFHLHAELRPTLDRGEQAVLQLGSGIRGFFEALARLLADAELLGGGDETALRITHAVRAGSAWQALEHLWTEAVEHQQAIERAIVEVTAELEALPGAPDSARDLAAELSGHLDYWREIRRRLHACIHLPGPGAVHWISGGGRFRSAWLNAAPLEVASLLRERLFALPEATILVSATLAIGDSFDYMKRRLGLDEASARALGSPFDYARAALLYVPNDLPDPNQPGYQVLMERTILDVVTRLHGRTLVLFTSRAHLRATHHALREPLAAQGIKLLAQGIDESSRTRLLEAFRRGSRVVLFGTNAFWEGIDVVGEALSCVMVTRLPFAVPTDPVYAARAEQFDDPFDQFAVPQAVLRLKQGFGRLIRSRADRGGVVVLDRRLITRAYGQVFVRSLPPCSVRQGPAARACVEIGEWVKPAAELTQTTLLPSVPG
ncbi:MAG: DEAD/DEAH box helicase [Chloroflexota bacterium]|nr:DEAD/DEAH box helicase [Chloroflexota bacterium]